MFSLSLQQQKKTGICVIKQQQQNIFILFFLFTHNDRTAARLLCETRNQNINAIITTHASYWLYFVDFDSSTFFWIRAAKRSQNKKTGARGLTIGSPCMRSLIRWRAQSQLVIYPRSETKFDWQSDKNTPKKKKNLDWSITMAADYY